MGGDYLLELTWRAVAYLVRSVQRQRKLRRAASWLPVRGLVRSVTTDGSMVEALVTYQFEGGYYCDYHERDLFSKESAKEYASRFVADSGCVIRINPARPEETAFFDEDQITSMSVNAAK